MAEPRRRLLLDVDTGIDDAVALLHLLATPDVTIEAITCTAGNVGARQVAINNLALLELCGRHDVEVAIGSEVPLEVPLVTTEETHGDQGMGYVVLPEPRNRISDRQAVDVWVDAARRHPGRITGVVTGPLTNLALALRAEPELPMLLGGLVIMGGAFHHPGNTTPVAEWNIHVDPHAAKEVFAAYEGLPLDRLPIVCALETTERIACTPAHIAAVASGAGAGEELLSPEDPPGTPSGSSNAVVACLSDALRFYMEFHREYDQGYLAHLHDLFAVMVATGEATFEERLGTVDVETSSPLTIGQTVVDHTGMWKRAPNARIVTGNDPAAVFELMVERLAHLARTHG